MHVYIYVYIYACIYIYTYIYIYVYMLGASRGRLGGRKHLLVAVLGVGLYKIFVHFKAFVHESVILLSPSPTCNAHTIAIRLRDYCAIYDPHPTPLVYAIHHTILAVAISCEGEAGSCGFSLPVCGVWLCAL